MSWCRLWVEMPNDPKWRTISRVSKQRIGDVISVFIHMMTTAAQAGERGVIEGWSDEDVASALDMDTEAVEAIRQAMQGRVLDGWKLLGWERRQPLREDDSAERARRWRNAKKEESNATERNRTQPNAQKRPDSDSDSDSDSDTNQCVSVTTVAREEPENHTHTLEGGRVEPVSKPQPPPPVVATGHHGIAEGWEPKMGTVQAMEGMGIPAEFVESCVPHFRLHHAEAGTQRPGGFESLFVGWVKGDWTREQGKPKPRAAEEVPLLPNGRPNWRDRQQAKMTLAEWSEYQSERYFLLHPDPEPEQRPLLGVIHAH